MDRKVKGAALLGRLRYAKGLGAETARSVLAALAPEERVLLEGGKVLAGEWYSGELLLRLEWAIASVTAKGDREAVLVAIGQSTADAGFGPTGALHSFAGSHDPHALLREVPKVHAGLQGAGARGYSRTGARSAVLRAVRGNRNGGGDCLTHLGWLRRAIELCGGLDVHVSETACIGRGGSCCEFRCEWR